MDFELITLAQWSLPIGITLVVTILAYWTINRAFRDQPTHQIYRQLALVGLILFAMVGAVLALPFDHQTRGQLLSLFGLVITAVFGLSSTTFVSNAMAGVTLKVIGSFHTGDFIRVGQHFGRVQTKTLLHTEIQSEDRDTITLPNMFVLTNPVQVVNQSGTLISAEVSLGYDVHRTRISDALMRAAEAAGLTEPFVQIVELGNFAVNYRVTGFLGDVSKIVSKRTELRAQLLDHLHADGIEVMTPSVMNQRPLAPDQVFLPNVPAVQDNPEALSANAEKMMFDKADMAARIEKIRNQAKGLEAEIGDLEAAGGDANALDISWRKHQLQAQLAFLEQVDKPSE